MNDSRSRGGAHSQHHNSHYNSHHNNHSPHNPNYNQNIYKKSSYPFLSIQLINDCQY